MSLLKYFKPKNNNDALAVVPIAATMSGLTAVEQNEVVDALLKQPPKTKKKACKV